MMPVISFNDLLIKIIKCYYPAQMIELHAYYHEHKQDFYSKLDPYLIDRSPLHLILLSLFNTMTAYTVFTDIKIFYQDFCSQQLSAAIPPAQFWQENALFYQGGGTTCQLPGNPTLFFTSDIVAALSPPATVPSVEGLLAGNELIKKLMVLQGQLTALDQKSPLQGIKKLSQQVRRVYPSISNNEVYILARLLKVDAAWACTRQ